MKIASEKTQRFLGKRQWVAILLACCVLISVPAIRKYFGDEQRDPIILTPDDSGSSSRLPSANATDGQTRTPAVRLVTVKGRVIDRDSGMGLGGFKVLMTSSEGSVMSAVDGTFAITGSTSSEMATIVPTAISGWALERESYEISVSEFLGDTSSSLLIRAFAIGGQFITVALVDAITSEPVPEFALNRLQPDGQNTLITSDRDGHLSLGPAGSTLSIKVTVTARTPGPRWILGQDLAHGSTRADAELVGEAR